MSRAHGVTSWCILCNAFVLLIGKHLEQAGAKNPELVVQSLLFVQLRDFFTSNVTFFLFVHFGFFVLIHRPLMLV